MELAYRGLNVEQIDTRVAELRGESEANTRNRLKLMFIVAKLATKLGIQVTEQEINGYISSMAAQRGERPATLKAELAKANRLPEVAVGIREHKTADKIISQSTIVDVSADEWNTFITSQAEEKARKRVAGKGPSAPGQSGKSKGSG
jgi:FKBP-type peptidyl-prolyl cis-trans isomerase (trigger factor)